MKIQLSHIFDDIVSIENLLQAWEEFIKGKRNKKDVQEFALRLMDNILTLHNDLVNHTYKHNQYQAFHIQGPKPRIIHKAQVGDRLLHHAIHRLLYPFFDKTFVAYSFSCRLGKGTHKALNCFRGISRHVSANNTKSCWVLKGDIKKFFASIDHNILIEILKSYIPDENIMWLLYQVIESFDSGKRGVGLPLGNLTSQLFANIYLNEFDQFIKHKLKLKHYIRYADDFVILADNKTYLKNQVNHIQSFLAIRLRLTLHPQKIFLQTLASGVDFLGWVHFPKHMVLRTSTQRRMMRGIIARPKLSTLNSYLGLLGHGNGYKIRQKVLKQFTIRQ
ncbi:MAG: reverse transcriptase/maturase family protein [bacterium]|nr:reverse transcriptase/maturase family protein [bacterium]